MFCQRHQWIIFMLLYVYESRDTYTYIHDSRDTNIYSFDTNINLLCFLRFRSKQLDWCTKCTQLVYTPVLQEHSIHVNVNQFVCMIFLNNLIDSILSCFLFSIYGVNGTRWLDVRSPFLRMTLPFYSLKGMSSLSLRQQLFEINSIEWLLQASASSKTR